MTYTKYALNQIAAPGGNKLVIYGFKGDLKSVPDDEYNSNVELFDANGHLLWKILSKGKSYSNFVGINNTPKGTEIINFDGIAFRLDLMTGGIEALDWRK
jgi:hypothetical protein